MANRWGKSRNSDRLYFPGLQNHCRQWLQPWNSKNLDPWKESYDQPRQHIRKQRHHFADKGPYIKSYGFPVVMYGCVGWSKKKAECWRIDAFKLWCYSIETCILSRVKQITSPGWMHETSARAWCTGKTQRNRVEREVGGGIGMGNTCKSMADSCQCMTKTTTIL